MRFTPEEEKLIKNHIPTVERTAKVFINCIDIKVDDEEKQTEYLLELIDMMEKDLGEVKTLLKNKL